MYVQVMPGEEIIKKYRDVCTVTKPVHCKTEQKTFLYTQHDNFINSHVNHVIYVSIGR